MIYTTASSIVGYRAIAPGWRATLTQHGALPDADTILAAYDASCRALHLDPNLALSQACHECTWFTSTRWTQEWNPAGLGITANNTPPNPFKTPQEGIQAHGEHLACYCYTLTECPCDHNHLADRRHFFHDGMPRMSDLERFHVDAHGVKVGDRMWAVPNGWPDTTQDPQDYVRSIVSIANSIVGASPVSNVPTAADLGYPGKVHYATGSGETMDISAVRWFIVHDTEGHFAGDEATLSGQISAHLLIDKTGEWRFMVPLDTVAYAAGNLPVNRQSINVEHSGFVDGHDGGYTDAQYRCCAAFYRFCVANGMAGVPAVYIGKQDADGGPEPDVPGILGHQDVPTDDGSPGWGGNYHHTDPGPLYDFAKMIGYIGNAPQPPAPPPAKQFIVDGHDVGEGFYNRIMELPADRRWMWVGTIVGDQYDAYLIEDANDAQRAKGLSAVAHPIIAVDGDRLPLVWDKGRTPPPGDIHVPLQSQGIALADDPELQAILTSMRLVNEPI